MIDNYIGSVDNEHHVTEYTLSTGKVITLTEEEVEEFVFNVRMLEIIEEYGDDE